MFLGKISPLNNSISEDSGGVQSAGHNAVDAAPRHQRGLLRQRDRTRLGQHQLQRLEGPLRPAALRRVRGLP